MCGDEASLRMTQGWQDGAASPTLQVAGTWGVHSCAHRCGLRGKLLNQVFPLNVHRNVKTYTISMSTVCCHHLPSPRGTNYVVRSCSRVSHEPVPSWAEHRGACVGAGCTAPCLPVASHLTPVSTALNTGTDRATHSGRFSRPRAYRREAGLGHNPLIKMENPGLYDVCPYTSHHTSRDERRLVHWPTQSVQGLVLFPRHYLTVNNFLWMGYFANIALNLWECPKTPLSEP